MSVPEMKAWPPACADHQQREWPDGRRPARRRRPAPGTCPRVIAWRASGRFTVSRATDPVGLRTRSASWTRDGSCRTASCGNRSMTPPLASGGVRVLDATQVMAGPFCAMQLCEWAPMSSRSSRRRGFEPADGGAPSATTVRASTRSTAANAGLCSTCWDGGRNRKHSGGWRPAPTS